MHVPCSQGITTHQHVLQEAIHTLSWGRCVVTCVRLGPAQFTDALEFLGAALSGILIYPR